MFFKKEQAEPTRAEKELEKLFDELEGMSPESKEYSEVLNRVERISGLTKSERKLWLDVSPDVWVTIGANAFGILAILGFERANVLTSKALGMVLKIRP